MENISITFIDEENNRSISYDHPRNIEFLDNGIVVVDCGGIFEFKTRMLANEWTRIEIEKW